MTRQQLINKNKRAIAIARLLDTKNDYLDSLELKRSIESKKPKLESFLTTPESWYLSQIIKTQDEIKWLKLRYIKTIGKLWLERKQI